MGAKVNKKSELNLGSIDKKRHSYIYIYMFAIELVHRGLQLSGPYKGAMMSFCKTALPHLLYNEHLQDGVLESHSPKAK